MSYPIFNKLMSYVMMKNIDVSKVTWGVILPKPNQQNKKRKKNHKTGEFIL